MITKAMILAAGFGKRINPLTLQKPKPLLEIGNETLLSNTLKFLQLLRVKEVIINVHYLSDQIINYINKNSFNLKIDVVEEKDKILGTGGGILNAINHFSDKPFLIINPDTIWNSNYLNEIKLIEKIFYNNKSVKCSLLVVKKEKSFDKSLKGDFNLKNNIINKINLNKLHYIYTGVQIANPKIFYGFEEKFLSLNKVWDQLIKKNQLYGVESNIDFLHVSTLNIYNNLLKKFNN